jgi:hypothetical protein
MKGYGDVGVLSVSVSLRKSCEINRLFPPGRERNIRVSKVLDVGAVAVVVQRT